MRVLLYAPHGDDDGARLEALLQEAIPRGSYEKFESLGAMSRRLQMPSSESRLAVILARSRDELLHIASFKSAFEGIQILLVLPDQDDAMVTAAHLLRPRYVTYRSEGFADLLAVLQRKISPGSSKSPRAPFAS